MSVWFPPLVSEAFPSHLVNTHVDGIGDLSYQSFVGDAARLKIECVITGHT